ncbi:DEAD/DEAH box helicase [Xylophilus ampelinus]|uniref:Superfamily II DNA/RNA helicase n=1 Tax=Xylophilus ampelinus TaxID=54067 RepID=A0A318SQP1_9BURK|nr:DEAD/DEAH box helicase [Xylophilus ampelinus]MCS4511452.1 DEAD/DEAH box helicase [Xylophilus ampelinus]PYE74850.1 superfamily II DNA/RNA helicase [Xylophilus ampelinus]
MTDTTVVQDACAPAENLSISDSQAAQHAAVAAQSAALVALVDDAPPVVKPVGDDTTEKPNGFVRLGLAPQLVQAVADLGFTQPTGVQDKAIPLAMGSGEAGNRKYIDLMVSSQTGSGKTAAFLLPVLHTLIRMQEEEEAEERAAFDKATADALAAGEPPPKRAKRKDPTNARNFKAATPGALILCPTRELAQQVAHDAIGLVQHCRGIRVANVVGGMPYQLQIAKLQNANLVVATPGRLLDLQRSQQLKLDQVKFLVVDEADRMLDLGFSDDLAEVNQLTIERHQTMMFSATFAPRIQQLAHRVMRDPQKLQIDSPQEKHANIQQKLYWADNAQHKRKMLDHWLRDTTINQAIVFASTQVECDGLANDLQQEGFSAVALHGALSQGLRNRRLMALRQGQVQILVATDVAARGIDVPTITHVFNFGLPMKAEDYTHRIGRTGRAGRDGLAVTFAEMRDRRKIFDIEGYSRQQFKADVIVGLEPQQRAPDARAPRGDFGGRGGRDAGPRGGGAGRFAGGGNRGFGGGGGGFGGDRDRSGPGRDAAPGGGNAGGFGRDDRGGGGFGRKPGFGDNAGPRFAPRGGEGFGAPRHEGARGDAFGARDGGPRKPAFGGGARPGPGGFGGRPAPAGKAYVPHDGPRRTAKPAR